MPKSLIIIGLCCIQPMWLQGQSAAAPKDPVTLSPASLSFSSQTVGTTSAASAVKLTNNQASTLTISSIVASGDFAQTSTCGSSVAAEKSCVINITFTPSAMGTRSGAVTITDDGATSPQLVPLSGAGVVNLSLSSASLSFGNQNVGTTSAIKTVSLSNNSTIPISISSIAITGDFTQTNTCGASLAAASSCSFSVQFTPTAEGTRNGTLTITDAATNSPQVVTLTGSGVLPQVTISPGSLFFARQLTGTTSAAQIATLTNNSKGNVNNITVVASGDFSQTNTCPGTLAGGASCTISVRFTPTAAGNRTGTVTITDSAPNSPQVLSLSGVAYALTSIQVSPSNPSIFLGSSQQFTATGSYSDGTTQDLTSSVIWTSLAPGVASISSSGLASSVATGNTTIQATSGSISGSSVLTVSSRFTLTGSMAAARAHHTATVLNNGKVLVTGGSTSGGSLPSTELYDPATGSFSPTGSMIVARSDHEAILLNNGKVLIVGGVSGGTFLASAELYDPVTGAFSSAGAMSEPRQFHTVTLLSNGRVLIAGGYNTASGYLGSAELYDPVTGALGSTASMAASRYSHSAVRLNNGQVLITGGFSANGPLTSAELYDPVAGVFNPSGNMSTPRYSHTTTLLNNGKVLIAGGSGEKGVGATAELYDSANGGFTGTDSMTAARLLHTATLLNNGKVLISGGFNNVRSPVAAELYDPASGVFNVADSMTTSRTSHTATLLTTGNVLLTGGTNNLGAVVTSAELYQPAAQTPAGLVSIVLTPANPSISTAQTQQFIATGTFSDHSMQTLASVTWNSSDGGVAAVSNDAGNHGLAVPSSTGATTISATAGSVTGSTTLTVIALVSISVTPANSSIALGLNQQFTATGAYSNGTSQDLTSIVAWSSSARA